MKWLIYGDILERHVVESLCAALTLKGVEIVRLQSVTRAHSLISDFDTQSQIQENLEKALSDNDVDVLFNFRVAELGARQFELLRKHGVFSFGWLPDDPLLYDICYRHVVEHYDVILHCGYQNVIEFYRQRHSTVNGFTFPFWTSQEYFPCNYEPTACEFDLGFLGNCHTANRTGRYELLASLPFKTTFFGHPPPTGDYCGIHGGYLKDEKDIPQALSRCRIGLSVPQFFADSAGTIYDFKELAAFESFYFPSRIVQYASCGIPTIIKNTEFAQQILPSILTYESRADLIRQVKRLRDSPDQLKQISAAISCEFNNFLSARSRAEMLLSLRQNRAEFSLEARANLWKEFPAEGFAATGSYAQQHCQILSERLYPDISSQKKEYLEHPLEAAEAYRILFIGTYCFGKTDIVSRMRIALEKLGHNVFEFNCALYPDAVHNPDQLDSGFGPIEIKLDIIMPVIRQFKPQLIVCCAGGYTFSEEDSQWLKNRGIVLVGTALSDPDVFPSEITFAHRFDYHTTNALLSLEEYKKNGLDNTLYFPFAIDRSFIENDIPPDPNCAADVICIGHADGRPERIAFMTELARHFNIRTYGVGWPFADSRQVYNDDFYRVAKAGKFHINFPGTRASHINVKIGVFESIACGGIVCTQYFDEMANFFEYETEIIGYRNVNDLVAKLKYFLSHPDEAEKIRRAAYARLLGEHMWEQRWNSLLGCIRSDLDEGRKLLPLDRYADIRLRGQAEPVRIVVSGFYGAENSGDELILFSLINNFSKRYENLQFTVCTESIAKTTLTHGVPSILRTDIYAIEPLIKQADLFILGGGGLIHDYSFNVSGGIPDFFDNYTHSITGYGILPTMAKIHDVPVIFFALGVGPLENPDAKKMIKFLCGQADVVTVRDAHSKGLLESIPGLRDEVILTADPTFLLDLPTADAPSAVLGRLGIDGAGAVGVCLRNWFNFPQALIAKFAALLDWIIAKHGLRVVFIPFQYLRNGHDNSIHTEVWNLMKHQDNAFFYDNKGNYPELLSLLGQVKVVLSMRLHGSILANVMGTPAIGFNYDPKIRAYFVETNLEQLLMPLDFEIDGVKSTFDSVVSDHAGYKKKLAENLIYLGTRASETFELAFDLIAKSRNRTKTPEIHYPNRISVRDRLKKLNYDYTVLQKESAALKEELQRKWALQPYPGLSFSARDSSVALAANWSYPKDSERLSVNLADKGVLRAKCRMSQGDNFYLVSSLSQFMEPPQDCETWRLNSGREYRACAWIDILEGNPQVQLWVMEFDEHERVADSSLMLVQGANSLKFVTSLKTSCFKVALRFAGEGTVAVEPVQIFGAMNTPFSSRIT